MLKKEDTQLIAGVGKRVFEKQEIVREMGDKHVTEDNQIAQINFE